MKFLEDEMRNLNESRKREQDVIPFERYSAEEQNVRRSLLPTPQVEDLRERWTSIQSRFVDEPRKAVEDADKLVLSAIQQVEEVFSAERANLEKQWTRGEEVSTEDLRICLQHYRGFFDRLLSKI
jgi:hypothetical protein